MKIIIRIINSFLSLCFPLFVFSQQSTATETKAPQLEFVFELNVNIGKAQVIGETGAGTRRIIPIQGGAFSGPGIKGTIMPGGADWQLVTKEGIAYIEARYTMQTDDSSLIYISNKGIRVASEEVIKKIADGEQVSPDAYYFRTIPVFETEKGKYDWLMKSVFIAKGIRNPDNVVIKVWRVL